MITISEESKKKLNNTKLFAEAVIAGTILAAYEIGSETTKEQRRLITSGKKTGRVYNVNINGRRIRHQASAPGQPPANLSGNLQRNAYYKVKGWNQVIIGNDAVSKKNAPYPVFLEYGTSRMAARPFVNKAIHNKEIQNIRSLEFHIASEIDKRVR